MLHRQSSTKTSRRGGTVAALLAASLLVLPSLAQADSKPAKKPAKAAADGEGKGATYQEPWGMAGYGLWSKVISDKGRDAQLGKWALGIVLPLTDSQTSGITSGTSNCVAARRDVEAMERQTFININLASLSKEAAQGDGQHLDALAEIMGCPHSEFAQLSQGQYGRIYESNNPDQVLTNYLREVHANKVLAERCQRVG